VIPITNAPTARNLWWEAWGAGVRFATTRILELLTSDRETVRLYLELNDAGYPDGLPDEFHAWLREVVGP